MPPFRRIPAEPTTKAVLRLLSTVPAQLLLTTVSNKVIAPGAVGKVSTKLAAVKATELLLESTIRSTELAVLGKIGLLINDLLMLGGPSTVTSATAGVPLLAMAGPLTVKPPTGIVFVFRPTAIPVTRAVTVHEPLAGMVPAVIDTIVPAGDFVPTHVPAAAAAIKPVGSASLNAAPVIAVDVGLFKVMVSVVEPFKGIVGTKNALLIVGRATFKVALAPAAFGPMLEVTAPARMLLV